MDLIRRSEIWKDEHRDSKFLAGLRVLLGLFLVFMGVYFAHNIGIIMSILYRSGPNYGTYRWWAMVIGHYIPMVHLAGGIFIIFGFLTRTSVIFQLPILIGAVFFANVGGGIFSAYSQIALSILVLMMLLFFLFNGPGIYSLDTVWKSKRFYE